MGDSLVNSVEVKHAVQDDMSIITHLLQLQAHDISEFEDTDVGEDGYFNYDSSYYEYPEADRHPFLVRVAGKIAGFALVVDEDTDHHTRRRFMAEFFILKRYRGKGVGQAAAFQLFDLYPGEWQVSELPRNLPAQAFWRKIIGRYTGGYFEEEFADGEFMLQTFHSPRKDLNTKSNS